MTSLPCGPGQAWSTPCRDGHPSFACRPRPAGQSSRNRDEGEQAGDRGPRRTAPRFAAALMTKYNLAGQDLQLQIDHPAARSLMVLLAVNLMVLPTASAQPVVLNKADFLSSVGSATRIRTWKLPDNSLMSS